MVKQNQSGQLALVIPVVLLITGGILAYSGYFRQSVISASYISSRTEVDLLSSSILQNLKDLLVADSPPGCPINLWVFRDFRLKPTDLTQSFDYNLDRAGTTPPPCLVNPTGDPNISALIDKRVQRISASVTILDAKDNANSEDNASFGELTRRLQISISIAGRAKGTTRNGAKVEGAGDGRGATSSLTKRYQLQIPRTAHFNVIFTSEARTPLIQHGNAHIQFNGAVLLASNSPYNLQDISDTPLASGIPNNDSVIFYKAFFTTAPGLQIGTLTPGTAIAESEFKQTFQGGIITSFLQTPTQTALSLPLPPKETSAWQVKYDFTQGQPLPNLSGSNIACAGTDIKCFDLNKANFLSIPRYPPTTGGSVTGGLVNSLDDTCPVDFSYNSYNTPAIYRYDSDFTLDFTREGNSFCGLIAAQKLIIKTRSDPNAIYQILGTFITKQIQIIGSGTVIFYNPSDNPALRQPLNNGGTTTTSTTYLNSAFSVLASGLGRPFFTPWIRDAKSIALSSKLWPQVPSTDPTRSDMLTPCEPSFSIGSKRGICYNSILKIKNSELSELWSNQLKPTFMMFDSL